MKKFTPHLDILPAEQKNLYPHLHYITDLSFVLYGGTAVALRLGHRESVDFDFFSDKPLDIDNLYASVPFLEKSMVVDTSPEHSKNSLNVIVQEAEDSKPVKMSFFGSVGIGRIDDPAFTEDGNLLVASLNDLMALKLRVILERAEAKDYIDIAAMLRSGVDLSRGLAGSRTIHGKQYQPAVSLRALTFFNDGSLNLLSQKDKMTLIDAAANVRDLPKVGLRSKYLGEEKMTDDTDTNLDINRPKP